MYSVYEKIMEIPLFKGAGFNDINSFVEKTPITFTKFSRGNLITEINQICNKVLCLLDGTVILKNPILNEQLSISRKKTAVTVLFPEYLYGLENSYPADILCLTDCSLMEFSKKQFFQRLHDNDIILVNYLNYLSKIAQKKHLFILHNNYRDCKDRLRYLMENSIETKAFDIILKSTSTPIYKYFGSKKEFYKMIDSCMSDDNIKLIDDLTLYIKDKDVLI